MAGNSPRSSPVRYSAHSPEADALTGVRGAIRFIKCLRPHQPGEALNIDVEAGKAGEIANHAGYPQGLNAKQLHHDARQRRGGSFLFTERVEVQHQYGTGPVHGTRQQQANHQCAGKSRSGCLNSDAR